MFTIYKTTKAGLEIINNLSNGCWVNIINPGADEIIQLQQLLEIPQDFITYPLDIEEMARDDKEEGSSLIVLRVPYFQGTASDVPYVTIPTGIIITSRGVIATICQIETEVIRGMMLGQTRGFSTYKHNRFILHLLLKTANQYLSALREINKLVDELEDQLQHSLRNRELVGLLKYQKSLVYFITALKSNELLIEHLQKKEMFRKYPDDGDLLDDVLTEVQQAIEMTNISSNILSQMMGAYAALISNNLNSVMKFLASVTIVVSLPTMLASFYGMNVNLPLQNLPWTFHIIVSLAVFLSISVLIVLWKKDWL